MTRRRKLTDDERRASLARGESQGPGHGGPARGTGTRPPFAPGNQVRLTHGAKAPKVYEPIAADLATQLVAARPDLAPYGAEVNAWARAEARVMLLDRHAAEVGLLDAGGVPHPFTTKLMLPLEREAARARAALGLTPLTDAAIAKERAATAHLAVDIEAILARGREAARSSAPAVAITDADTEPDPLAVALDRARAAGEAAQAQAAAEHYAATGSVATGPEENA